MVRTHEETANVIIRVMDLLIIRLLHPIATVTAGVGILPKQTRLPITIIPLHPQLVVRAVVVRLLLVCEGTV